VHNDANWLQYLMANFDISDQLPKSHRMACKAYRYDFSQKTSAGMLSRQPRRCRYATLVHTIPVRALTTNEQNNTLNYNEIQRLLSAISKL